jgi:PKD repeat protein
MWVWTIQKQSVYQYYHSLEYVTTEDNVLAKMIEDPGKYRVMVSAFNDIDRPGKSQWLEFLVAADPQVELEASVLAGTAPLPVGLLANASGGGRVRSYEWDLNGDGTVNRITRSNALSQLFEQAGVFSVQVTAVSDGGLRATDTAPN